ncbi:MAG: dTMP kinase [Chloroflexi bacterium]|nr:dTMP kinase [Chloroflexota bacterium]
MPQPLFITLEGGEAAGKSTQTRLIAAYLTRQGYKVTRVAEPGSTKLGSRVRRLVKYGPMAITPLAETMLFLAARTQLVEEVINPALGRGEAVVSDRFADSTLAYQGYGRGLDVADLRRLNDIATGGLTPDLTVLLDMPVEASVQRRKPRPADRFELELPGENDRASDQSFHEKVRQGFLALAQQASDKWLVVDAGLPRREVSRLIRARVSNLLKPR